MKRVVKQQTLLIKIMEMGFYEVEIIRTYLFLKLPHFVIYIKLELGSLLLNVLELDKGGKGYF